ncbi:hypothetical protein ALC57_09260 [Trachymyrmex cornetzi]|uniref:Uncharacterized protein n=1 Tax=Trachymyrmex cornetzi TaxID=471704 RepID=A0A151J5P7_9HYME|nr:hypothetical protein ALC57_09260 [Trachymyrmex cornetzi]
MWKQFTHNGNYKWIVILPRLVSNYNARKHRTISMRPVDVTPAIADRLLITVYNVVKTVPSSSPSIQDLNLELVKVHDICDTNNVKLYGTCLYMKPTTVLFLFELE